MGHPGDGALGVRLVPDTLELCGGNFKECGCDLVSHPHLLQRPRCATLALELPARWGVRVSAETIRRWLHELGWAWKRAKLAAKDDDPQRVEKLARIRYTVEHLPARAALFFADELDISLLAKVGYQWMPKGEQLEVLTPGTNEKRYLAGAWDLRRGTIVH